MTAWSPADRLVPHLGLGVLALAQVMAFLDDVLGGQPGSDATCHLHRTRARRTAITCELG
jgi:hypothetical protein